MQGGRVGGFTGFPGGRFSLGRLKSGSGYCVGAVIESRMGIRDEKSEVLHEGRRGTRTGTSQGQEAMGGNGMRDVWVIGEGFFRGAGGVFDVSTVHSSWYLQALLTCLIQAEAASRRIQDILDLSAWASTLPASTTRDIHSRLSIHYICKGKTV